MIFSFGESRIWNAFTILYHWQSFNKKSFENLQYSDRALHNKYVACKQKLTVIT